MADKDTQNKKTPLFISEDELEDIKAYLAKPAFRRYKYMINDIVQRYEKGDFEGIRAIREAALNDFDHIDKVDSVFTRLINRLNRVRENGFSQFRREKQFIERLRHMMSPEKKDPISGFPLGKMSEEPVSKEGPTVESQDEQAPSPISEVDSAPEKADKEPIPELSPLADYTPEKEAAPPPVDVSIEQAPASLQHELVSMGVPSSTEQVTSLADELPELPETVEEEEAPVAEKAPPLVKKPTKKKRQKPAKKEAVDPDKEAYYKERKERIQEYIDKEQKRGTIDVREGGEE